MRPRLNNPIVFHILVTLLLSACAPAASGAASAGTRAWVDQPVTNAILPLAPFMLRGHGSRSGGGIVKVVFLANSIEVGNGGADPSADIVTADSEWTPSAPGEYLIQFQVISADGVINSDPSRVCVSAFASDPQTGYVAGCSTYRMPVLPIQPEFTFTQTNEPSLTPLIPSLTPFVPSVTPAIINVTMLKNAFCRKGPSVLYEDVTAVTKDEIVQAQGRNDDATWMYVYWKKYDVHCWIAVSTGTADGEIKSLPIQSAPPEPTLTAIIDFDGDGYSPPADCNDKDASIHPGAFDPPKDGIDQNCNGDPDK